MNECAFKTIFAFNTLLNGFKIIDIYIYIFYIYIYQKAEACRRKAEGFVKL